MVAYSEEVSDYWVETNRICCLLRGSNVHTWWCLVLEYVRGRLLREEQVIDVNTARVGDSNKDAWTEGRPLHLHHVLIVTWLEYNDWSLVQRVVQTD